MYNRSIEIYEFTAGVVQLRNLHSNPEQSCEFSVDRHWNGSKRASEVEGDESKVKVRRQREIRGSWPM